MQKDNKKQNPFSVPEGYFESFPGKLQERIREIEETSLPVRRIGRSAGFRVALAAAILGGMESIGGAILGGVIIGVVEGLAANYLSGMELGNFHFGDIKDVAAFAIMIIVLMIRPHGIFGKDKVERV